MANTESQEHNQRKHLLSYLSKCQVASEELILDNRCLIGYSKNHPTIPKKYNPEKELLIPLIDFINNTIHAWKIELKQSPIKEGIRLAETENQKQTVRGLSHS